MTEYSAGNIAAYEVDDNSDPIPATRQDFVIGPSGAESAFIDGKSGDFLFATSGGSSRLIVVRGFELPGCP